MVKFLIGGSPCTHWSIAQSKARETEPEGIGWELFKNYLIAKEKFQPDFFLYENNKSAAETIKARISEELGTPLQYINSALVSAQNRWRFYAHNIPGVEQPEDRHIMLADILESVTGEPPIPRTCVAERVFPLGTTDGGKAYCLTANYSKGSNIKQTIGSRKRTLVAERIEPFCLNPLASGKSRTVDAHMSKLEENLVPRMNNENPAKQQYDCIIEPATETTARAEEKRYPVYEVSGGKIFYKDVPYAVDLPDGFYIIRKLTVKECCRLQTLPDDYCWMAKKTNAYKGLGNGWTAEVIMHILSHALAGIPKYEEIIVLSMYDGIGTGRYCFDKLGYRNIRYFAYEIEKPAIEIAKTNFPDIVQRGDAFSVRGAGWNVPL